MTTEQLAPTATTKTLEVPGVVLTYDIRTNESSTEPVLFMIGSPMGAGGFGTLAGHFADRTVVTYDPRGVERSVKADPASESTPDQHADDLHRIIEALGAGPVDVFASSGGAVNALALVAAHPEDVRTLVAHEPPAAQVLPDREPALAAVMDIYQTYQSSGFGPGMAKFIAIVSYPGPISADYVDQPAPDPANVRTANGRRWLPQRRPARPEPCVNHPLPAGLRSLATIVDQHRHGRWRRIGGHTCQPSRTRNRGAAGQ